MATLRKAPPLVLAIMLSVDSAIGVVATTLSFSLADDPRETGETVTANATSDTRSSGRGGLSRIAVRFTMQDGGVVNTTLQEPVSVDDELAGIFNRLFYGRAS